MVDVVNHELEDETYDLTVYLDNGTGRIPLHAEQFMLGHNQAWEKVIDFMPDAVGDHQKLEFDLYAGGDTAAPYRSVYLWVNVSPSGEPYSDLAVFGYNHSEPGRYADYWEMEAGKGFDVTIRNHEYRNVPYSFEIALNNGTQRTILYTQDMLLAHNESWARTIVVRPDRPGMNMTLEFDLYAYGNRTTPYRFLNATTNVTEIVAPEIVAANSTGLTNRMIRDDIL
jgi:uncharacterized membrane protein